MKKIAALILVLLMLAGSVICVQAAGTASANGPSVVRAGDTITVSFVAGSGITGGEGNIVYDASQLTLVECSKVIGGNWAVEIAGSRFVFYENNLQPLTSSATIFKATFKVNPSLASGTEIKVAFTNVILSDGTSESVVSPAYKATIAPPLSGNCDLASLTVSNATISPAFAAGTTFYTASVPYSVSSLQLAATAADAGAKVSINNPTLTPGGVTNVRVTVTAENGATKEYTIQVTRAQDPNYVKSNNANLSALSVEGFLLSPAFSQDVTRYFVWLPYEQETVSIVAKAADQLASIDVGEQRELTPGMATDIAVTVTAEDGTQKVYTLTVFRAPAHADTDAFLQGERAPEPETEPPTEPVTEPVTEPSTEAPTEPSTTAPTAPQQEAEELPSATLVLIFCLICLVVGFGLGILVLMLIQRTRM